MSNSHVTGWALDAPTPAQLKELFAQIESGRVTRQSIQAFLRGEISSNIVFSRDMRKDGWTLLEAVTEPEQILITGLEIFSFLKEGEDHISGEEMRSRAKDIGTNLGQKHAEHLLEHQADIPKDWRSFYLVFSGTLWRDPGGFLRVPYLAWGGGRWCLSFRWLGFGWCSGDRLLCARK